MLRLLLPIILSTSMSVRSPKIEPNPYDYEVAFEIHKPKVMYVSRQWERELNRFFIDEEYWAMKSIDSLNLVFKEKYVNKTSRGLEYNQFDLRWQHKEFTIGYALRHIDKRPTHNLVIGFDIVKGFNVPFLLGFNFTSNMEFVTNFNGYGISKNTKINANLSKYLSIYFLWKYDYIVDKAKFYQYKTGVQVEIPQFKKKGS